MSARPNVQASASRGSASASSVRPQTTPGTPAFPGNEWRGYLAKRYILLNLVRGDTLDSEVCAWDALEERHVAIRRFARVLSGKEQPSRARAILREVILCARLSRVAPHPNVRRLFTICSPPMDELESFDVIFVVLELCSYPLRRALRQPKPPEPQTMAPKPSPQAGRSDGTHESDESEGGGEERKEDKVQEEEGGTPRGDQVQGAAHNGGQEGREATSPFEGQVCAEKELQMKGTQQSHAVSGESMTTEPGDPPDGCEGEDTETPFEADVPATPVALTPDLTDVEMLRSVALALVSAVAHLHTRGVCHRFLAADHGILLGDIDGHVKIADFGAARLRPLSDSTEDPNNVTTNLKTTVFDLEDLETSSRVEKASIPEALLLSEAAVAEAWLGKRDLRYTPPEALLGEMDGAKGDVWALGCVIVELFGVSAGIGPWPPVFQPTAPGLRRSSYDGAATKKLSEVDAQLVEILVALGPPATTLHPLLPAEDDLTDRSQQHSLQLTATTPSEKSENEEERADLKAVFAGLPRHALHRWVSLGKTFLDRGSTTSDDSYVHPGADLPLVERFPMALEPEMPESQLFTRMLRPGPDARPRLVDCLQHPYFTLMEEEERMSKEKMAYLRPDQIENLLSAPPRFRRRKAKLGENTLQAYLLQLDSLEALRKEEFAPLDFGVPGDTLSEALRPIFEKPLPPRIPSQLTLLQSLAATSKDDVCDGKDGSGDDTALGGEGTPAAATTPPEEEPIFEERLWRLCGPRTRTSVAERHGMTAGRPPSKGWRDPFVASDWQRCQVLIKKNGHVSVSAVKVRAGEVQDADLEPFLGCDDDAVAPLELRRLRPYETCRSFAVAVGTPDVEDGWAPELLAADDDATLESFLQTVGSFATENQKEDKKRALLLCRIAFLEEMQFYSDEIQVPQGLRKRQALDAS